jgi:hypothetical protein
VVRALLAIARLSDIRPAQGDSSAVEVNAAEAGKTKRNSKRKHKKSVEGGTAE